MRANATYDCDHVRIKSRPFQVLFPARKGILKSSRLYLSSQKDIRKSVKWCHTCSVLNDLCSATWRLPGLTCIYTLYNTGDKPISGLWDSISIPFSLICFYKLRLLAWWPAGYLIGISVLSQSRFVRHNAAKQVATCRRVAPLCWSLLLICWRGNSYVSVIFCAWKRSNRFTPLYCMGFVNTD